MSNLTLESLIEVARDLASDNGENAEYDRALVELVSSFIPGDRDLAMSLIRDLIVRVI